MVRILNGGACEYCAGYPHGPSFLSPAPAGFMVSSTQVAPFISEGSINWRVGGTVQQDPELPLASPGRPVGELSA